MLLFDWPCASKVIWDNRKKNIYLPTASEFFKYKRVVLYSHGPIDNLCSFYVGTANHVLMLQAF